MSITWRKSWLSCFESPISVFDKICFANVITQKEFHHFFNGEKIKEYAFPLINQLDYKKLQDTIADHEILKHFQTSIYRLSHIFHSGNVNPELYFCKKLYLCEECSINGYHSFLFQSRFIVECPFHSIPLTNICRNCGSPLMYNFFKSSRVVQCCNKCYEPILRHSDAYPNYSIYTEQKITSSVAFDLLNLNEKEIKSLQNTTMSLNKDKYGNADFLLYCIRESAKNRS